METETITPAQARVARAVEADPGVPLQRLSRRLALSIGTVAYHVARLERKGVVHALVAGRRRPVFPGPRRAPGASDLSLARVRHPTAHRIAEAIVRTQGATPDDLLAQTGLSRRAVYHHLHAMRQAQLIETSSRRNYDEIKATAPLSALLARLRAPADP